MSAAACVMMIRVEVLLPGGGQAVLTGGGLGDLVAVGLRVEVMRRDGVLIFDDQDGPMVMGVGG